MEWLIDDEYEESVLHIVDEIESLYLPYKSTPTLEVMMLAPVSDVCDSLPAPKLKY